MPKLCQTCRAARDHPHFRFPIHLVHLVHHKPMVFDVRSEAMCPHCCGAIWRRCTFSNAVELVT